VAVDAGKKESGGTRKRKPLSGKKEEVCSKNNLTGPTLLEMSGYGGGLNRSTQHSARTHIALKTKAKSAS
jgi:hypothetical protein